MLRQPAAVPAKPGIYALVNKTRHYAYVAFTTNLQKRSHSMSHMLVAQDKSKKAYWPISDLPKHKSDEYTFIVLLADVKAAQSAASIALAQKKLKAKNYRIVEGQRAAMPMVTFKGKKMTLVDAMKEAKCKSKYLTVYRRIERGWSVEQALDIATAAPRWDHKQQAARRKRAEERTSSP